MASTGEKIMCPACGDEVSIDHVVPLPTREEFICSECARGNINRETRNVVEFLDEYEVFKIGDVRVIVFERRNKHVYASIIRADGRRMDKEATHFTIERMREEASKEALRFALEE